MKSSVFRTRFTLERLRSFRGLSLAENDPRGGDYPHCLVTLRYDKSRLARVERGLFIRAL